MKTQQLFDKLNGDNEIISRWVVIESVKFLFGNSNRSGLIAIFIVIQNNPSGMHCNMLNMSA